MKIIGRNRDGLIVHATDLELANIAGFNSPAEAGKLVETDHGRHWDFKFKDGAEINVHALWVWTREARKSFDKIKESAEIARVAASILDRAPPEAIKEPDPTKQ